MFISIVVGLTALLVGLLAYGILRWREDGALGQLALAVGWGGLMFAYFMIAQCVRELNGGPSALTCLSLPAAVILGLVWLILWLLLGLVLDYRHWTRLEAPLELMTR